MRADTYLFLQLFCSIWIAIANGSIFCFALLTKSLETAPFHFGSTEINTVSTVGVVLSYFSLPTGYIFDEYGPRVTLAVGALINFAGWFLCFCIWSGYLPPSLPLVACCYAISQLASSYYESGTVLTNLDAFALHQGRIVIIQKTFMGLGSSVIALIFTAFFSQLDIKWFLLTLCGFSATMGFLGACVVRMPKGWLRVYGLNVDSELVPSSKYNLSFRIAIGILILSLCFIVGSNIASILWNDSITHATHVAFGYIILALSLSFALMIWGLPKDCETCTEPDEEDLDADDDVIVAGVARPSLYSERTPLIVASNQQPTLTGQSYQAECRTAPSIEDEATHLERSAAHATSSISIKTEDGNSGSRTDSKKEEFESEDEQQQAVKARKRHSSASKNPCSPCSPSAKFKNRDGLLQNLRRVDLWMLWWICFGTWGGMAMVNSNTRLIYTAIAPADKVTDSTNSVFVSIFGAAGALGRIVVGALAPFVVSREYGVWAFLPVAGAIMACGLGLFLVVPHTALILPFFLTGFATGISWGSIVLVMKTLFFKTGVHYNFLYTAGMLTPMVFNIGLFSQTYAAESARQGHHTTSKCHGTACITISMLSVMGVNLSCVIVGIFLVRRLNAGSLLRRKKEF